MFKTTQARWARILYNNPSKCESRKSGQKYSFSEAIVMFDKRLEELGMK